MSNPEGGTFIDIPKVFTDKAYEKKLKQYVTDPTVLDFWNKEMAQTSDYHKSEVLGWFVSKFGAFLSNQMMRDIIGQSKSSFNLRDIMDNQKILLVNLSKGRTGELNSKLLGMIFVMKFQAAAMSRANVPEDDRKDFSLYVDEFQNFSTDSFATILSEARKYRLNLIVANQFTTQLTEEIRDSVFGNIGTIISYRVGTNDADFLAKQFAPVFNADDLQRIPNGNVVARMLIGGIPTQAFSMSTLPSLGKPNEKLMNALKQLSAAKYGRPRAKVDAEIMARIRTPEPVAPARPASPYAAAPGARPAGMPPGAPGQRPRPAAPGAPPSFLDDWLSKRNAPGARPAGPAPAGMPPARPVAPAYPQAPYQPPVTPVNPAPAYIPPAPVASAPAVPPVAPAVHTPIAEKPADPPVAIKPLVRSPHPAPLHPSTPKPVTPLPTPVPAQPKPELKLKPSAPAVSEDEPAVVMRQAPLQVVPDPDPPKKEETPKSGEIKLKATVPNADAPDPEDTIFIDPEGVLHRRDDDAPTTKPS